MATPFPGLARDDVVTGVHLIKPRAASALMLAVERYPDRWSKGALAAATMVPGIFDDVTVEEAADALDTIARVADSAFRVRSADPV